MTDWILFIIDKIAALFVSMLGFLLSMWFFNKYIFPKMAASMGSDFLKGLQKDPEIKPVITKAKDLLNRIEPIVDQFKKIDLDKIQEEYKPLLEAIKKIDPKTIEDVAASLKSLTNDLRKKLEKPTIPKPD